MKDNALTKAWVVWRNGSKKTFYSYDTSGRYEVEDPREYGMRGLMKRVVEKWGDTIERAIIYDNKTGVKIYEFLNGEWQ
ncbi:hypothetical protein ACW9KT_08700 [Hymenobacter sp. HD11105]